MNLSNSIYKKIAEILTIGTGIDLSRFIKSFSDTGEFEKRIKKLIDFCLDNNIDISWINIYAIRGYKEYDYIIKGLKDGLDISWCANPKFDISQIEQIYMGLVKNIDVSIYANLKLDAIQMQEIRKGLQYGIDVSIYIGHPKGIYFFSSKTMYQCRQLLRRGINIFKEFEKQGKNLYDFNVGVIEAIIHYIHDYDVDYKKMAKYITKEHNTHDVYNIFDAILKNFDDTEIEKIAKK